MTQKYSDHAQIAALEAAKTSIDRNAGFSPSERDYLKGVLDCIRDRIEDALIRRTEKQREPRA